MQRCFALEIFFDFLEFFNLWRENFFCNLIFLNIWLSQLLLLVTPIVTYWYIGLSYIFVYNLQVCSVDVGLEVFFVFVLPAVRTLQWRLILRFTSDILIVINNTMLIISSKLPSVHHSSQYLLHVTRSSPRSAPCIVDQTFEHILIVINTMSIFSWYHHHQDQHLA